MVAGISCVHNSRGGVNGARRCWRGTPTTAKLWQDQRNMFQAQQTRARRAAQPRVRPYPFRNNAAQASSGTQNRKLRPVTSQGQGCNALLQTAVPIRYKSPHINKSIFSICDYTRHATLSMRRPKLSPKSNAPHNHFIRPRHRG